MPDSIDNSEDIFLPQSDRLQILSPEEYELLWGVPRFSQYDRDDSRAILFRSVRELLMNVVKHAGASSVTVSIQREDNAVKIVVEDDGAGMPATMGDVHPTDEGGFGLFSIEERMNDLGGSLSIESSPGQGVRAILTVPFEVE